MKKLIPFILLLSGLAHATANFGGYQPYGDIHWKQPVASVGTLPTTGNVPGDTRIETTTFTISTWNGVAWVSPAGGGGGSVTSVSGVPPITVSSPTTTPVISCNVASGSQPGCLSSSDWTNFNSKIGAFSIGALDAQAENANGLALVGSVLSSQSADSTHPGMVNNTTQTISGAKTFTGVMSAPSGSVGAVGFHLSTDVGTGLWRPGVDQINISAAGATVANFGTSGLAVTGVLSATGALSGSNFSGSSSGSNTGDVTLAAVGSSPSANGASLSGQVLTLQPADTTHPGALTAADWNTFNGKQSTSLTNTHIYVGNVSAVATDVALSQDCSMANTGAITCTKTNNVSFAASATTDTTNASNISSGTISVNRFNSGTGASSSTYLSGAGTWTTPTGGFTASTITTNTTLATGTAYACDSSSGNVLMTLPDATASSGKMLPIVRKDGTISTKCTLTAAGTDTFNPTGVTSIDLTQQNVNVILIPFGTQWMIFGISM